MELAINPLKQSAAIAGWPDQTSQQARGIAAVSIGNALEWFDFVIYGYFAAIIARLFFPSADPAASLLLAFASFGITFLARPLGAIVIGRYADRIGRKAALQLSLVLMMMGSLTIAVVPVYETIGFGAPAIMLLARTLQGFSVGGEFGSATAIFAEQNPRRRGFYASWQFASQGLAAVLATGFGAAMTSLLSPEQIGDWGWRLPFFFGAIIGPVGIYIRRYVSETPDFKSQGTSRAPLQTLIADSKEPFFVALGLVMCGTVAVYTIIFMPTYAVRHLSLSMSNSLASGLIAGTLHFVFIPMFGAWSDRIGRTPVSIVAAIAILLGIYPALAWLSIEPTIAKLLIVQGLFGIATAAYLGSLPALMAELFDTKVRGTGLSVSYAVGVAIFGGFAPFIHEWLIGATGDVIAPSYYLIFSAVIGLAALCNARRLGHT